MGVKPPHLKRKKYHKWTQKDKELLVQMRQSGASYRFLANYFESTINTIRKYIKQMEAHK